MQFERRAPGRGTLGLLLLWMCFVGPVWADTLWESEPNDTPTTANATVGINGVSAIGAIDSASDQDYFSFLVTQTGVPIPGFTTAVQIAITENPGKYFFELTHESGTVIFSGIFAGPYYFDFNANAVGGIGRYTLRIGAVAPYTGTYAFSIVGVADGSGAVPPTVLGTASVAPTLDKAYGTNGVAEVSFVGKGGYLNDLLMQRDGQVVADGLYIAGQQFGLAVFHYPTTRFTATGITDPTFGTQGFIDPSICPRLLQSGGTIIGCGPAGIISYGASGAPNPAFATDGAVGVPGFAQVASPRLAGASDGKIVFAGSVGTGNASILLMRFHRDGTLDTAFNHGAGSVLVPHGDSSNDVLAGLAIQPDGKIVMAATSNIDQTRRFALIRYNADGAPDAGFGSNGRAFAALSAVDQDDAYSLALQPNGRLVLAGREGLSIGGPNPIVYIPLIVGFSSTGVVDPTFGDGGPGLIRLGIGGTANAITAQPDGKLLVSATGGSTPARLMRFTADGHADTTFGAAGAPIITRLLSISAISLQPDGNIVIGGGTASGLSGSSIFPTGYNFAASRYINGPMAAIEFYNASLDHYFMSMNPQEVGDLDLGVYSGWTRTQLSFLTYGSFASAAGTAAVPVCRFYIPPEHGNSHFFSADPVECAIVRIKIATDSNFSGYVEETTSAFYIGLPDKVTGTCPANATPVYRLWNQGSASNHRYTSSVVVKNQMIAKGWVAEGYGPDAVDMCAPR